MIVMMMVLNDLDPFCLTDQVLTELCTSFVDADLPVVRYYVQ